MQRTIVRNDTILLESTGREFYAHSGVIGLGEPDDSGWRLSQGFDGGIGGYGEDLDNNEKIELAEYMIELWTRYKNEIQ